MGSGLSRQRSEVATSDKECQEIPATPVYVAAGGHTLLH